MRSRLARRAVGTFLIAIGMWIFWVWAISNLGKSGPLFDEVSSKNLATLGVFGDSFGVLSALMATIAASGAILTLWSQKEESSAQEFERNLFILINSLQLMVSQIDVSRHDVKDLNKKTEKIEDPDLRHLIYQLDLPSQNKLSEVTGRDAFRHLVNLLRAAVLTRGDFSDSKTIAACYEDFYNKWHDDLGHYFRTLYHIFKMIAIECPDHVHRQRYANIVRAHLSSAEVILLAYNCSVGIGRFKFKKYLRDFRVLHNFYVNSSSDFCREEFDFFSRCIGNDAFSFDETEKYKYNDFSI